MDVIESSIAVQGMTYEVATTLTQEQLTNLPVFDRQITNLFATQAGVEQNGVPGGSTVINGTRSQATNVTLDGINVQDQFFPSVYGLGMDALTSASYSSYHSAQIDVRRRLPNGQQLQINYTFSKALADANADLNTNRFEPYLDANNGKLDKARALRSDALS